MKGRVLAAMLALAGLAGACGGDKDTSGAAAKMGVSESALNDAREVWKTRCVTCHGDKGGGDGPGSAGLTPPPRNMRDTAWQKEINDEHLQKIILGGGGAVGKSPAMPPNPDLNSKPEVVKALAGIVRSLAQ